MSIEMQATDETAAALKQFREIAARPFEDAHAMPPAAYTVPGLLALERERVFGRDWLCVGRASAVGTPGDYVTYDIAGQPVVVLRDGEGAVRCFSNVCRHRMSTLLTGSGNVHAIVCPYHAWSYNLDGSLRGAPHMRGNPGFCKDDYRLPELRTEVWLGWIYVTLNAAAVPVVEELAELADMVRDYDMGSYIEAFREEHVWDTNWKILAENFMESYHLPVLHRKTIGPYSKVEEMQCPPGRPRFNYHWITKDASLPIGNAHPNNRRLQGEWRRTTGLFTIYPNHLITLTPGYFWYLIVQPVAVDKVHMIFGGGLAPEFMADPQAQDWLKTLKTLLDTVNTEDRQGVEAVFKGVRAPLARPGHLSHLERPNYDFAQYIWQRISTPTA